MWFVRFFVFRFHESPRYLIGKGRDEEAIEVIHTIAKYNGKADRCTITVDDLRKGIQGPIKESTTFPVQVSAVVVCIQDGRSLTRRRGEGSYPVARTFLART